MSIGRAREQGDRRADERPAGASGRGGLGDDATGDAPERSGPSGFAVRLEVDVQCLGDTGTQEEEEDQEPSDHRGAPVGGRVRQRSWAHSHCPGV